ncbi:MAG: tRNA (N(6)-L-threonylcarbamoyladenosine(37)-C(2))-methylthiotransferase MtaB [Chloroflexota bacterium]
MAENQPVRVALATLGCKLNQAESELIARNFTRAGYEIVPPDGEADVYLLNTCTVTHIADAKARKWLRASRKRSPQALVVACGCYAERAAGELAKATGAITAGNETKDSLLQVVSQHLGRQTPKNHDGCHSAPNSGRNRSLVKIQDGCQNFCSYCIVPFVRRREISLGPEILLGEINRRVEEGCREVVLTGTRIGAYLSSGTTLTGLTKRILAETGISRLRLSSLQPQEISEELVGLWANPRLCRHFHLALQSGCDPVLRRMRRRYTAEDYRRTLDLIRERVPRAAITTDIIVGFPGETEAEFETSHLFARETGFARIHVFPYSPRQGTAAADMASQVAEATKNARRRKMLALARESRGSFCRKFLGEIMDVLWEQPEDGIWSGLTDNYLKVYARSGEDLSNRIRPVKLIKTYDDGLWGEVTPPPSRGPAPFMESVGIRKCSSLTPAGSRRQSRPA